MILPVLKFVVFFLAPFFLLIWTTSPDLWSHIFSSACLVGDNTSSLLQLPSGLLISGEALVKILTCNDLDLHASDHTLLAPVIEEASASSPLSLEGNESVPLQAPVILVPVLTCKPWLLTRLVHMGLNAYFPQLSPVSSLWSPLRAAIPVIHWAASWWFVSPGCEPNLVILAPSLTDLVRWNYLMKSLISDGEPLPTAAVYYDDPPPFLVSTFFVAPTDNDTPKYDHPLCGTPLSNHPSNLLVGVQVDSSPGMRAKMS
ncbi:hypothetical protein DSO57_1019067 [Entomophthora muscae]|uniref:Uncharacterized protein n=1 Tax=Entomophthora muscae TaxID=34485 RepID=A0ACC2U2T4_9FUNG|nr:hypothetical protein DSO57_1019067 [Entomophthora muscae]